jgi:hypothetical protein
MVTLSTASLTVAEIAKRTAPNGSAADIGEILNQALPMLDDIPWSESNQPTSHQTTLRTSLPVPTWRAYNAGIASTKSTTGQSNEPMGMLEDLSELDEAVADVGGNRAANRMNEATAHLEGMAQEMGQTIVYGNNGAVPEEPLGFFPRYASTTGITGENVILGGGSGSDNSSILLSGWKLGKIYGIYPKGTTAGLVHRDMGLKIMTVTAGLGGNRMLAYVDHFKWYAGLAVEDWRYAARIANIDISNLVAKSSAADLFDLMIKAMHCIPNLEACNPVFYMNRTVFQQLDIQARDDVQSGGQLGYADVAGRRLRTFQTIPIRLHDQLVQNEATIA